MRNFFGASGGRKFFLIFISVILSNVVLGAPVDEVDATMTEIALEKNLEDTQATTSSDKEK